jgi:methenyltetrahydromethanopterin cyclohydrolase
LKDALSVNRLAWPLVAELTENADLYGVKVQKTTEGATVIDAGINTKGGLRAGRLITEICMGGLGKAEITSSKYDDLDLPTVFVYTDHPTIATLASQLAGWHISGEGYSAIGSGPARALALKPKKIYKEIRYKDKFDKAIVILETENFPPSNVVNQISKDCGIRPEKLKIIITPTTSLAGVTQISGRIVETGIQKLRKLGIKPETILHAWGSAPIPPLHPKLNNSMGRTNDAILYGGTFACVIEGENQKRLARIVDRAPSNSSKSYGKPFVKIFQEANNDFYKIESDLFAPAVVIINDARTGRTIRNGKINIKMLKESFDISNH